MKKVITMSLLFAIVIALTAMSRTDKKEATQANEPCIITEIPETVEKTSEEWNFLVLDYTPEPAIPLSIKTEEIEKEEDISEYEEYLLAKIAMAEAESEDIYGKALVMCVVKNRVKSSLFPNNIEDVIFQKEPCVQFSPTVNGRWEEIEPDASCYEALDIVIYHGWDESQGAIYFDFAGNDSDWHANREELFTHGGQTFYR